MANLLGQKIEPNYRGILNTETLNSPISASLQKITDGQNNISALSLSTGQVGIAGSVQYDWVSTPTGVASKTTMWFDATGRMSWRPGTGAASYVRTFDATGITANRVYTLPDATTTIAGLALTQTFTGVNSFNPTTFTNTSGTVVGLYSSQTFAAALGTGNFRPLSIEYVLNNSGAQTGTATGIFLNATETNLNSMSHNLITLQRGGVNYFNVTRAGLVEGSGWSFSSGGASSGRFLSVTNGVFVMYNSGANGFTRLNFGAQDATKPALQVNGTGLEVRLADGSALTALSTGVLSIENTVAAAVGIASTHKVTISIGGVTYYLLASNV